MKQSLQLGLKQTLKMTPQLQQAIRLLQLSAIELDLEIKSALESNPMLETEEQDQEPTATDLPVTAEWDDANPENFSRQYDSNEADPFENLASSEVTLQDHLLWQLNLTPLSDRDRIIAFTIIDAIADDGYLHTALSEIQTGLQQNYPDEFANLELEEITAVLRRIQQFDPLGVASRDLQECLLLQLEALPEDTPQLAACKTLVQQHLDLLAKKQHVQIKNLLKLNDAALQTVLHTISQLHPHPGELIANSTAEYIMPDVIVSKQNAQWVVRLNPGLTTHIRINPSYAAMVKHADNSRDNKFLGEQLNEARWLLNGIKIRNETLLKVATSIIAKQREFLEFGEEKMQPLILQDIAKDVAMNESTISRITSNKYILTPRGIFELKYFFSSHVSKNSGDNCSSTAIKAIIKQLISKEPVQKPLSDQDIAAIMMQRGIKIARRTVAKYREALGIKASSMRK